MGYPNSITRGLAAPLSPVPSVPKPRPDPTPSRPRRKPGRPAPERPRRPPAPAPRPSPQRPSPTVPKPLPPIPAEPDYNPANPGKPGRKPDADPGLPYGRKKPPFGRPRLPGVLRRFGPAAALAAAAGDFFFQEPRLILGPDADEWDDVYQGCMRAGGMAPYVLTYQNVCLTRQYISEPPIGVMGGDGPHLVYWPGTNIFAWLWRRYYSILGNVEEPVEGTFTADFEFAAYKEWRTNATPGDWNPPVPDNPPLAHVVVTPVLPLPLPTLRPWQQSHYPHLLPVNAPDAVPQSPPVTNPIQRPEPWSPEAPDVGPRPQPKPQPEPVVEPVPVEIPTVVPEIDWLPNPIVNGHVFQKGLPRPLARPHRARKPPKGTKERKARLSPWLRYLWNSFSPITEAIDLIDVMYECLPKDIKISAYKSRGRQPNPKERLELIYQHINDLDVACALLGFVENQIEDMLYSIGSGQIAEANRKDNRPIGYEAGGGLNGNRPYVGIMPIR